MKYCKVIRTFDYLNYNAQIINDNFSEFRDFDQPAQIFFLKRSKLVFFHSLKEFYQKSRTN